jgi:DNA topoisomerase-2
VLYVCLKRKLVDDYQGGAARRRRRQQGGYHHGEASLQATIVNMAQHYVGAHNVNLLYPAGMFGTRRMGGKDARRRATSTRASRRSRARCSASTTTPCCGWRSRTATACSRSRTRRSCRSCCSTARRASARAGARAVPSFHPLDVAENVERALAGQPLKALLPWWRHFAGTVHAVDAARGELVTRGVARATGKTTIEITELPVGRWTTTQKEYLEEMVEIGTVESFRELHTEHSVHFVVTVSPRHRKELGGTNKALMRSFRLESTLSLRNMHLFDSQGRLQHFETAEDIVRAFVRERLPYYERRLERQLVTLTVECDVLRIRGEFARFMVLEGGAQWLGRPRNELLAELQRRGFPTELPRVPPLFADDDFDNSTAIDGEVVPPPPPQQQQPLPDYEYLLRSSLSSFTAERVQALESELQSRRKERDELDRMSAKDLWRADLAAFKEWVQKDATFARN